MHFNNSHFKVKYTDKFLDYILDKSPKLLSKLIYEEFVVASNWPLIFVLGCPTLSPKVFCSLYKYYISLKL